MTKKSKRYKKIKKQIKNKEYSLEEALNLLKKINQANFDESVELHVNLNIDPKKSDQIVKGFLILPHGSGKKLKIAAFTESQQEKAKKAGADLIGGQELVDKILKTKKINFDIACATADFMPKIAKAAKILGPQGAMPSPKNNTVTQEIDKTIKNFRSGQVNFRNDTAGNVHQIIGKVSWDSKKLKENIETFLQGIKRQRPKGIKGSFVHSITICSTMGPGIKIVH